MKAKQMAQEYENTLAGLVSDLRLTTDFEDINDTLAYIKSAVDDMLEENEYYWNKQLEE